MLTESPKTALGAAGMALKDFARKVAGTFLERFTNDPVTFGLTSLWPKKLNQARDLSDGLYLTIDSVHDGTLELYEQRRASSGVQPGLPEDSVHRKNPSTIAASYNQKARPYLGEGLEGTPHFDLGSLLSKEDARPKKHATKSARKTRDQLVEERWKELKQKKGRDWTDAEVAQLRSLYASYNDLDTMDVIPLVASMLETESSCSLVDIYLKLSEVLGEDEVEKLKRPDLDDSDLPDFGTVPSDMDSVEKDEVGKPKLRRPLSSYNVEQEPKIEESSEKQAFVEGDTLDDSSSSESGFDEYRQSKSGGKTVKMIREEMQKRKLELQALEQKRKEELAGLAEKRREERVEQKRVREAEEKEAKEKRLEEKKLAQQEKERQRQMAQESKVAAKREKLEAIEREKEEKKAKRLEMQAQRKKEGKRGRPIPKDPEAGDASDDDDDGEGSKSFAVEDDEIPKARPKRAATGRRRVQSDFDKLIDGLDSDDNSGPDSGLGPEYSSTSTTNKNNSVYAMDVDPIVAGITDQGTEASSSVTTSVKKGKRSRFAKKDDDDEYMEDSDEPKQSDDEKHNDSLVPKLTRKPNSKKASSAKTSSSSTRGDVAGSTAPTGQSRPPTRKKPKLTNSTSQLDSAPLEASTDPSSVFTTVKEADENYHTTTTVSLGTPNKRRLVRNANEKLAEDDDDLEI